MKMTMEVWNFFNKKHYFESIFLPKAIGAVSQPTEMTYEEQDYDGLPVSEQDYDGLPVDEQDYDGLPVSQN